MNNTETDWHAQETYRSMIAFGHGLLRFTFLANGAAIISILTFLGDLYTKEGAVLNMGVPLLFFIAGVFLSGLASLTTYLIQFVLYNESINELDGSGWGSHMRWLYITLALLLFSILTFAVGSFCAISQLQ